MSTENPTVEERLAVVEGLLEKQGLKLDQARKTERALALMLCQQDLQLNWILAHAPKQMQIQAAQECILNLDEPIQMYQQEGKATISVIIVTKEEMDQLLEAKQKSKAKILVVDGKTLAQDAEPEVGIRLDIASEL